MEKSKQVGELVREGRTPTEIAETLGIAFSSVLSYLHRAVGAGYVRRSDVCFSLPNEVRAAPQGDDAIIVQQFGSPAHALGDMYDELRSIETSLHKLIKQTHWHALAEFVDNSTQSFFNGEVDRLIELKSPGVDARVQTMSWNEWKSARASDIRERFWLYLVGNLRADLAHAHPFVRAIKDPFGTLTADEVREEHVRRAVQLRVREFTVAEHLDLGVRTATPQSPELRADT